MVELMVELVMYNVNNFLLMKPMCFFFHSIHIGFVCNKQLVVRVVLTNNCGLNFNLPRIKLVLKFLALTF